MVPAATPLEADDHVPCEASPYSITPERLIAFIELSSEHICHIEPLAHLGVAVGFTLVPS